MTTLAQIRVHLWRVTNRLCSLSSTPEGLSQTGKPQTPNPKHHPERVLAAPLRRKGPCGHISHRIRQDPRFRAPAPFLCLEAGQSQSSRWKLGQCPFSTSPCADERARYAVGALRPPSPPSALVLAPTRELAMQSVLCIHPLPRPPPWRPFIRRQNPNPTIQDSSPKPDTSNPEPRSLKPEF
jgi:hypothetical protein